MKVNLGSKIAEIRTKNGLSQSQFASVLGITQAQISNIEKDYRGVSPKIAARIKEKYDIDIYSFILAKGFSKEVKPIQNNCISIPFYHIGAAAGAGTTIADSEPESDMLFFDERWLKNILGVNPNNLHLIFASGDSMDSGFNTINDIKNGDLLLVDTSQLEGNNRIFVILVNNQELRVKKLFKKLDGTLIISSNNPKYKEEVYTPNDTEIEIKVIGKVVWNGSKENI